MPPTWWSICRRPRSRRRQRTELFEGCRARTCHGASATSRSKCYSRLQRVVYNCPRRLTCVESPTSVVGMIRCRRLLGLLVPFFAVLPITQLLAQRCGVERWAIKTGTDAGASQGDLQHPKNATIADLIALPAPKPLPTTRVTPTETTVFVVNATLSDYKFEGGSHGDSDYHLVLEDDQGNTMIAEIPSPSCL